MNLPFDPLRYSYPSRRNVIFSNGGMVGTGNPLAAQAGLRILQKGGNAVDAAIATASTLTVVEPTGNGIGGDAFAIIWMKDKIHGMNSSGYAAKGISAETLRKEGHEKMPIYGFAPVTVPGIPAAWAGLSEKFGKLPLTEVLAPAVEYARYGYPLQGNVSKLWKAAANRYKPVLKEPMYKHWFEMFLPGGKIPAAGDIWKNTNMANSLEEIATTKAESFYRGNLMERILKFSDEHDGYFDRTDFENYKLEWVEPLSVNYRGYDIHELPPNCHGISVLMALNIIKAFEFGEDRETFHVYHKQIEALKLAFIDAQKYIADPASMEVTVEELLSEAYAKSRRDMITDIALEPQPTDLPKGGTVYLATADNEGNMVSYIQSNYMGFGSALVVPETGISLHNRGNYFTLEPGHPNELMPGKRPYHTIIPGFITKGTEAIGPFGIMGGPMQPQAHMQVASNLIDFRLNPQDALDAPRWQWMSGKILEMESHTPNHVAQQLARAGHDVKMHMDSISMGRGQVIYKLENGVYCGGTEPRTDGHLANY